MKKIILINLFLCFIYAIADAQTFTISSTPYSACAGSSCAQGRIVITKQFNTGTVTYGVTPTNACHVWNNDTLKFVAAGTFTITGTDAASISATTVVTLNASTPSIKISSATTNLCSNGLANLSTTLSANFNAAGSINTNYCTAESGVPGFEEISSVSLGSFTSGSGCGFTGTAGSTSSIYSNHTNQIINVVPGGSYACGITVDTCYQSGTSPNSSTIFIDLNIDGDFSDPGERVYASAITYNGGHTETGTILIPANASIGYTRIRFINAQNNSGTPCGVFGAGEVEDYTLHIGHFNNTWSWSNSTGMVSSTNTTIANGALASIYTVSTTDAFGCSTTATINITSNPASQPTIVRTDGGCSYAKLAATFTSGTPSLLWQPGNFNTATITNLASAIYTLTATDANGCVATSTSLVDPAPPILANAIVNNIKCAGQSTGSVTLVPSGGIGPYFYQWTPAAVGPDSIADNLSALTYTVKINDAISCSQTFSFTITQPNNPLSVGVLRQNISGPGASDGKVTAIVSGGTPPYTYAWSHGTSALDFIENCPPNIYTVTVTDAAGCSSSATANVFEPGAMALQNNDQTNTIIYPTLITSTVNITSDEVINDAVFYDVAGKKILEQSFTNNVTQCNFDLSFIASQVLYLQINGRKHLYKIIKH
jgi:large repetitive protein